MSTKRNIQFLKGYIPCKSIDNMKTLDLVVGDIVHIANNYTFYVIEDKTSDEAIQLPNSLFAKPIPNPIAPTSPDSYTVDTIEKLKELRFLKEGNIVEVLGYYQAGDGAGHKRKIESEDDGSGVLLNNGLYANIIHNGEISISWFGAKGDGVTDDSSVIQNCINWATPYEWKDSVSATKLNQKPKKADIIFPSGKLYRITKTIFLNPYTTLRGSYSSMFGSYSELNQGILADFDSDGAIIDCTIFDENGQKLITANPTVDLADDGKITHCKGIKIINLSFIVKPGRDIAFGFNLPYCHNMCVENNYIGYTRVGVRISLLWKGEFIYNNITTTECGVVIDNTCTIFQFRGNYIITRHDSEYVMKEVQKLNITNPNCKNKTICIYQGNNSDVSIFENILERADIGIYIEDCDGVIVNDNYMESMLNYFFAGNNSNVTIDVGRVRTYSNNSKILEMGNCTGLFDGNNSLFVTKNNRGDRGQLKIINTLAWLDDPTVEPELDTVTVYVDFSGSNDANSGLTQQTSKATLDNAIQSYGHIKNLNVVIRSYGLVELRKPSRTFLNQNITFKSHSTNASRITFVSDNGIGIDIYNSTLKFENIYIRTSTTSESQDKTIINSLGGNCSLDFKKCNIDTNNEYGLLGIKNNASGLSYVSFDTCKIANSILFSQTDYSKSSNSFIITGSNNNIETKDYVPSGVKLIYSSIPQIKSIDATQLNTPYHIELMEQEGGTTKQDFYTYLGEKIAYDKQLEAEEKAKYEAYELLLKGNPNLTWEEFEQQYGNNVMMNLSLVERLEEPVIPESVVKFMEKYLGTTPTPKVETKPRTFSFDEVDKLNDTLKKL